MIEGRSSVMSINHEKSLCVQLAKLLTLLLKLPSHSEKKDNKQTTVFRWFCNLEMLYQGVAHLLNGRTSTSNTRNGSKLCCFSFNLASKTLPLLLSCEFDEFDVPSCVLMLLFSSPGV